MSALDEQVGGDHYKKYGIQPVELWLQNDLGPIEAACIKYLTRWRDKGGAQDLWKVEHMIRILQEYVRKTERVMRPHRIYVTAGQYCAANGIALESNEHNAIDYLMRWRTSGIQMLDMARGEVMELAYDAEGRRD